MQAISPLNKENSVPIVITPHKGFIPCMAVLLQSIIENSNKSFFYDIIVIHSEIPIDVQNKYKRIIESRDNFSLRFFSVSEYILRYKFFRKLVKKKSLYLATFYRLLIPELLCDYEKVIYLDADIVVNVDVANMLEFDISNYENNNLTIDFSSDLLKVNLSKLFSPFK